MLKDKRITVILPHDPEVKTFPFSEVLLPKIFRDAYEVLHSKGILGKLESRNYYFDAPQLYVHACEVCGKGEMADSYGFGGGEDEVEAVTGAIAEAVEHYCILHERKGLFVRGTYSQLKSRAVDPRRFLAFTKQQLAKPKYKRFVVEPDSNLNWLEGYSLTKKKKVLIPASLVYANYSAKKHGDEPIIRMPISTGAACGLTDDFAIYRGLCEIIERDAYMISLLPEMPKKLVVIDKNNPGLSSFVRRFVRYEFELFFFDTSLESKVYSVVCLLVDRSGSGPAVCAGLGASLEPEEAIKTSAIEALRRYSSNRNVFFRSERPKKLKKGSLDWFIRKKQQLWSAPHMIGMVENLVKKAKRVKIPKAANFKTDKQKVKYLVKSLARLNCEVFYVDMTPPEIKKLGLRVIKVLCPEMVPLWRDDRYPYFGVERFLTVPKKYNVQVNLDLDEQELMKIYPF